MAFYKGGSGMELKQTAFVISAKDNVATALAPLEAGIVRLTGESQHPFIQTEQDIPAGHKLALRDIALDEDIIKYGVVIGRATQNISAGSWVHLHCMRSLVDERSSHLDAVTGAPCDIAYD